VFKLGLDDLTPDGPPALCHTTLDHLVGYQLPRDTKTVGKDVKLVLHALERMLLNYHCPVRCALIQSRKSADDPLRCYRFSTARTFGLCIRHSSVDGEGIPGRLPEQPR
jgi:hypothetical protein